MRHPRDQQGLIPHCPGIYRILNLVNGKRYIGSAKDLRDRWSLHRSTLRAGTHANRHLQFAWRKYGEQSFRFEVLFFCLEVDLKDQEQVFLDLIPHPDYYNIGRDARRVNVGPAHNKGVPCSEEQKARITVTLKAFYETHPEERARISTQRLGTTMTGDARGKISAGLKKSWDRGERARQMSPEARQNMAAAAQARSGRPEELARLRAMARAAGEAGARQRRVHIERVDPRTGEVKEYPCVNAVVPDGFSRTAVGNALKGRVQVSGGFWWRYAEPISSP